jgi:hypothetical protein
VCAVDCAGGDDQPVKVGCPGTGVATGATGVVGFTVVSVVGTVVSVVGTVVSDGFVVSVGFVVGGVSAS